MFRPFSLAVFSLFAAKRVSGYACNACTDGYSMTDTSSSFNAGLESLSCNDLLDIATQREHFTDVCGIVQDYSIMYCSCRDSSGNPPPPRPYISSTTQCNPCGGDDGSDLWTIDADVGTTLVNTGISGFQAQCGFLYETGLDVDGWFTSVECETMQDSVRSVCGCALRNADNTLRNVGGGPSTSCTALSEQCSSSNDCCDGLYCHSSLNMCLYGRRGLRGSDNDQDGHELFMAEEQDSSAANVEDASSSQQVAAPSE